MTALARGVVWRAGQKQDRKIQFLVKELGDHTNHLRGKLRVGLDVMLEGPYGCFTYDDDRP
jgi:predicted ferric reductase